MPRAFIVVDMLHDFVDQKGSLSVPGAGEMVPALKARLQGAREAGELVVFVCDAHDPDDLEFKRYPPHAVVGTTGAQVIPELAPLPGEPVLVKKRLSAFYGTGLDEILRHNRIDAATVTGVVTHICVMETVAGLCERDIPCEVPLDSVADFDPEMAESALKRMTSVFGAKLI